MKKKIQGCAELQNQIDETSWTGEEESFRLMDNVIVVVQQNNLCTMGENIINIIHILDKETRFL